nr:MAG TPA: hypothetical protein [Caudoviricetes sp.]
MSIYILLTHIYAFHNYLKYTSIKKGGLTGIVLELQILSLWILLSGGK